jgi:type VI secretion system protein
MIRHAYTRCVAVTALSLQLTACSLPKFLSFEGSKLGWDSVTLSASANANRNSAVAVDVALALDEPMAQRLQELSAEKWFSERNDLQKTFPASVKFISWELVPGQMLRVSGDSLERPRVLAAYAFADYGAQGPNRQRIEKFKGDLVIRLDEKSFAIVSSQ